MIRVSYFKSGAAINTEIISFVKSGIRLGGYFLLLFNLEVAVGILILSEIIGIIEELV